jgi:3-phosphoshikimate 1-carboxyvinyltransferase
MNDGPRTYPERLEIVPLTRPPTVSVRVPGSKSITNRALVLAALTAKGFTWALQGALRSEDTEVMIDNLRLLGFRVLAEWDEETIYVNSGVDEPTIPVGEADLFVANSGTTMRFLTAMVSLGHGRYRIDGIPRMRERPIQDLLDALTELGAKATSETGNGCPPVVVETTGLRGGRVRMKGNTSSQFLSAVLMAAPYAASRVTIDVKGSLVSRPYVDMTVRMMEQFGFYVVSGEEAFTLEVWSSRGRDSDERNRSIAWSAAAYEKLNPHLALPPRTYEIEPDASAASYFFGAAAITGGTVTVPGLGPRSHQGDVTFVDVLEDMSCAVERRADQIRVSGAPLHGIDVDMNDISDTAMTLAAVACFAEGPTTIRNVAHIRHKETDRLAALATELRRLGAEVDEFADGLTITPRTLHGAEVDTYNDHRMAMSLALIGLRVPGVVIKNPGCVAKTYPDFWRDLERLRHSDSPQSHEGHKGEEQ